MVNILNIIIFPTSKCLAFNMNISLWEWDFYIVFIQCNIYSLVYLSIINILCKHIDPH